MRRISLPSAVSRFEPPHFVLQETQALEERLGSAAKEADDAKATNEVIIRIMQRCKLSLAIS